MRTSTSPPRPATSCWKGTLRTIRCGMSSQGRWRRFHAHPARGTRLSIAIRTESLTRYYGPVVALEALDLSVAHGEVYGFLGPNGAGKTTTIRILLDLVRPTSGRAFVDGLDCRRESVRVRARIGYLPA